MYIELAKDVLKGTGIQVASTLNFPIANDTLPMKIAALKEMIKTGVDQFDFPPNPGLLLGGEEKAYFEEMKQIVEVAHASGVVVKAMLEFGYITTPELKAKAAQLACEAGIDWVKQSSGWGVGGCVKVSGKVNTLEKMKAMFEAGAELVGTSSGPAIVDGLVGDINAY